MFFSFSAILATTVLCREHQLLSGRWRVQENSRTWMWQTHRFWPSNLRQALRAQLHWASQHRQLNVQSCRRIFVKILKFTHSRSERPTKTIDSRPMCSMWSNTKSSICSSTTVGPATSEQGDSWRKSWAEMRNLTVGFICISDQKTLKNYSDSGASSSRNLDQVSSGLNQHSAELCFWYLSLRFLF